MIQSNSYNVTVDNSLMKFLQETAGCDGNRFTKFDAYVYLLEAASDPEKSHADNLSKGQFITTFSELAEVWNWHRTNVRLFLTSLEKLKALAMERQGKATVITMPIALETAPKPVRLIDGEEREWLRFIFGMAALDEFLALFDASMTQTEEKLAHYDDGAPVIGEIGARLRSLLNHLMLRSANILPCDKGLDDALRVLFIQECNSDLQQLLGLLTLGGFSLVGDSVEESVPFQLTENADRLLHEVIRYYSPWLDKAANSNVHAAHD